MSKERDKKVRRGIVYIPPRWMVRLWNYIKEVCKSAEYSS